MRQVTIHEAKTHLSQLVEDAVAVLIEGRALGRERDLQVLVIEIDRERCEARARQTVKRTRLHLA